MHWLILISSFFFFKLRHTWKLRKAGYYLFCLGTVCWLPSPRGHCTVRCKNEKNLKVCRCGDEARLKVLWGTKKVTQWFLEEALMFPRRFLRQPMNPKVLWQTFWLLLWKDLQWFPKEPWRFFPERCGVLPKSFWGFLLPRTLRFLNDSFLQEPSHFDFYSAVSDVIYPLACYIWPHHITAIFHTAVWLHHITAIFHTAVRHHSFSCCLTWSQSDPTKWPIFKLYFFS